MIPQFQHKSSTSLAMWMDSVLTHRGQAFSNRTGVFYPQTDDRLDPRYTPYASPYKQWVTDSSASGIHMPSGISGNGGFIPRGESGLVLDFNNGRALFSGDGSEDFNYTLSGTFPVKDFNIYLTNQSEEDLIVESKFDNNNRFQSIGSGIAPYKEATPAIFVSLHDSTIEPFAFGGLKKTNLFFRCTVFADNLYQLDGALSLFVDTYDEAFPEFHFADYPLTELGDIKDAPSTVNTSGAGYNYDSLVSERKGESFLYYIENVHASKVSQSVSKKTHDGLFLGVIDFEVCKSRYTS
jgi:hypothetical protein